VLFQFVYSIFNSGHFQPLFFFPNCLPIVFFLFSPSVSSIMLESLDSISQSSYIFHILSLCGILWIIFSDLSSKSLFLSSSLIVSNLLVVFQIILLVPQFLFLIIHLWWCIIYLFWHLFKIILLFLILRWYLVHLLMFVSASDFFYGKLYLCAIFNIWWWVHLHQYFRSPKFWDYLRHMSIFLCESLWSSLVLNSSLY
jgi:hypothetical protein